MSKSLAAGPNCPRSDWLSSDTVKADRAKIFHVLIFSLLQFSTSSCMTCGSIFLCNCSFAWTFWAYLLPLGPMKPSDHWDIVLPEMPDDLTQSRPVFAWRPTGVDTPPLETSRVAKPTSRALALPRAPGWLLALRSLEVSHHPARTSLATPSSTPAQIHAPASR